MPVGVGFNDIGGISAGTKEKRPPGRKDRRAFLSFETGTREEEVPTSSRSEQGGALRNEFS